MKKAFAILLTVLMVLSLAACAAPAAPAAEAPAAPAAEAPAAAAPAAEAPAASGEAETLTVWCWDPAFNLYAMEEAAKVYQQTHPEFVLNIVETPWEDIQTKVTTAATSGDLSTLPDIFLCQDNAFQKNVISFPEVFVDLTGSGIDYSQFAGGKVGYSVVEGKNYGVPFDNGAVIACLRTDIIAQAGYGVADFTDITWSQFITLAKDVLAKTGKPLLSMQAGESDLIMMMMQSAGSSLFTADGKADIVGNATLKEVVSTYAELVKSGVMIQVNDWDEYIGSFVNETVAGTINGCWILASVQTAADQAGKWAITNMPRLDNIATATNYSNNGGSSWAVSSNCKNPALAFDFLASTFAGSVPFYETILPSAGALATYLPAGDSDVYGKPVEFFNGEAIYSMITEFAGKVPSNNTGIYYYEARDAVATALTNVIGGADVDAELAAAQDTVDFLMAG